MAQTVSHPAVYANGLKGKLIFEVCFNVILALYSI
jgi:hypothetical protein